MLFNYTSELRTFFENLPENSDYSLSHSAIIENGRTKLFDFDYPIFDEQYRKVFETHFIRKFYMRQIGFETFGLFKFQLETWLLINMPYFNKMFESELLQYDPLTNAKMEVTQNKTNNKTQNDTRNTTDTKSIDSETQRTANHSEIENTNSEQSSSMSGNSDSKQSKSETGTTSDDNFDRQLESNNPDSRLSITANDGEGAIEYASSIKENTENNTKTSNVSGLNQATESSRVDSANKGIAFANKSGNESDNLTLDVTQTGNKNDTLTSTINNVDDFVEHRVGKVGNDSFAKMVQEYRASLLRVEKQIFDEMNELFMLVY